MALTIWLTDRSRYSTGTGRCRRERYLKNHFGSTGYGIVRKAESLPLMTGSYTHEAIELLYRYLQQYDAFPPVPIIRAAIATANAAYEQRIQARGFRGLLQSENTDRIIVEQQYLIAGMIWALCRNVLPWMHEHYRILQVEQETIYMLGCTCGLGSATLDVEAHDARGCLGVAVMLRQDCVAQKRQSGTLAYFEAKTTGWGGDNWAPQWETRPQLAIGNFGIKERYGQDVSENFIVALYKGARKTSQPKDAFEEAVTRQESPFCYGYLKKGNPPLAQDEWLPSYEWQTIDGQTKRASRAHVKTGLWELVGSDWAPWAERADQEQTPVEVWSQQLPQSVLDKQVYLIGPLNPQDQQIASLKSQMLGEEQHWQQILWELYELQMQGIEWRDTTFQQELDRLVPASWECRRFGVKHECEFKRLCFKEEGWQDPLATGVYVPRRPHHTPELAVAVERGLLPEQSEEEDQDES